MAIFDTVVVEVIQPSEVQVVEVVLRGLQGNQGNSGTAAISPDGNNIVEARANGLFVPDLIIADLPPLP